MTAGKMLFLGQRSQCPKNPPEGYQQMELWSQRVKTLNPERTWFGTFSPESSYHPGAPVPQ